jgi:N-acetylglutamate synthase-like GNAT family acetyltransferase
VSLEGLVVGNTKFFRSTEMEDNLQIRSATKDDLPSLLKLYRHLISDDPILNEADASKILDQLHRYEGSSILIGLSDGEIVSSCTLIIIPNLTRGGTPYALIENVVTHSKHRKRGIGRAILEAATNSAWQHGCYKVMLLTGLNDPGTFQFYEKAGFTQTKTGFQIRRMPPRQ